MLVAAVATGLLAGRCVRQPRIGFIVWTAATLGLTIALAAQSMGFASGFGPATFRAVQLFALMLAPLWLAWGLVELAVGSDAARFGVRLISAALTVVAPVILATDPLTAQPFGKAWPLTGTHFQPVSRDALDVVQVVAVVIAVAATGLAAVRASRDSGPARDLGPALTAVVPAALAVLMTAGQRFPLPAKVAYPVLSMVAAALVWFAVSRVGEPPRRQAGRGGRGEGMRDRRGRPGDDYRPDDQAAADYGPEGQYATYGQGRPGGAPGRGGFPGGPAARAAPEPGRGRRPGPRPPERPVDRPYRGSGPGGLAADDRPGTQPVPAADPGVPESGLPSSATRAAGSPAAATGAAGSPAGRPRGRTAGSSSSPCSTTGLPTSTGSLRRRRNTSGPANPTPSCTSSDLAPNAPLQRIFYEIYRDRAAFDSHAVQGSPTCSVSWLNAGRA